MKDIPVSLKTSPKVWYFTDKPATWNKNSNAYQLKKNYKKIVINKVKCVVYPPSHLVMQTFFHVYSLLTCKVDCIYLDILRWVLEGKKSFKWKDCRKHFTVIERGYVYITEVKLHYHTFTLVVYILTAKLQEKIRKQKIGPNCGFTEGKQYFVYLSLFILYIYSSILT